MFKFSVSKDMKKINNDKRIISQIMEVGIVIHNFWIELFSIISKILSILC